MSRQPPFPSSSSRRQNNNPPPVAYDARFEGIMPLSVSRPQSRPITPSSSSGSGGMRPSPARPVRSERRPRHASQYSITSISSRDIPSDAASYISTDRAGPSRSQDMIVDGVNGEQQTSPVALQAVVNAFQQAGAQRKRAMTNGTMERERERERELEEEAKRQRRLRDKVTGRRVNGKSKAVGNIDSVLDRIEDDWAFVVDPEFNPVDLALQLLDSSSSGKDINSFRQTKLMLSRALKGSVDKHYQAFAAALPHHAYVLNHLDATQVQVVEARIALQEAKDALGTKRSDLIQLSVRGQTIEEMLGLLDEIEHLKTVPESLESLMSEKRLLHAAGLLVRSLRTIKKPEMLEIGAVSDLRSYLISQETSLRDILIDELHSHLFLKSFWCESRWSAYVPNQAALPAVEYDNEAASTAEQNPSLSGSTCPPRLKAFLTDLATKSNDPPLDLSDAEMKLSSNQARSFSVASLSSLINREATHNPERDSFAYLETLLESLAVLGKLGSALDIISQRLPGEMYSLVDQTINEVHERAELSQRSAFYAPGVRPSSVYVFAAEDGTADMSTAVTAMSLRLAALESMERQTDHEVLRDLFWTLYSKLDAVTQGLRVVYEVSNRIGSRRDFKDSSGAKPGNLFPLAEIWLPIQSEIRTLLSDYLSDEEKGRTAGRNPISSINEILRESKFYRDRGKQVFRFADADPKATGKSLRLHEDELNLVLRDTVPGLVQGALETAVQTMLAQLGTDDRLLSADHHRLLTRPDAFHVSVLFQPTLTFLTRVVDVLPAGLESTRASTELLDDFVLNVYLPQLEEKSSLLFHTIVTGHDAFLVDPASLKLSSQPLLKACTQLMALINSLCAMLRTTPFHRDNYSRLILSVIIQFYQRCSDRFQDVVSRNSQDLTDTRLLVAARWAQQEEIAICLSQLMSQDEGEQQASEISDAEMRIELRVLASTNITKEDLLSSMHDLSFLSSLYHSITWFVDQLRSLRSSSPEDEVTSPNSALSPTLLVLPPLSSGAQLQLPLSRDMGERFGSLILTYEQLARIVLFTIRLDIRCRAIYFLTTALCHGNYRIDQDDSEPDPHIIDLNTQLGQADECICTTLPEKERLFVFEGLETLMEELMISNARSIRFANIHGIRKILRNIVAIRQNLKTLSSYHPKSEFDRAREFYGLFSLGPQAMLDSIKKEKKFTFEEYQAMLNLQCGVDQTVGQAGVNQASDRNYSMYVIELHGFELEHSTSDPAL